MITRARPNVVKSINKRLRADLESKEKEIVRLRADLAELRRMLGQPVRSTYPQPVPPKAD